ncbi:tetratricopeptide (TPR) repeat protein [Rhizobium tibeticum]|uniref:hypothetical protein n=1 Tax=Rhizobium tibeticum TaxID=501024 RepID=UPI0027863DA3|nr:hypothetical protein [Rhizobium tibeticum]MDP9807781.1 tetratricopeptide (TPR) repeat protein [Rhizobium tibeticum]
MPSRMNDAVKRFFAKFDDVPLDVLADRMGISTRTLKRLREGDNQPSDDTVVKMTELIKSANDEALGTPAERVARAEALRAAHEKQQREIRLAEYRDQIEKRYPLWFIRVREHILAERYNDAIQSLSDHIEDPVSWEHVDSDVKPYVLHALGVAYYRFGANLEARQASEQALRDARKSNNVSPLLKAWVLNMQGLSAMRLWDTDQAFKSFESARTTDPSVDASYYNAICCASLLKAEDHVGFWTGQYVASCHLFSTSDIEDVISRARTDKDLVFFRGLPIMKEFMDRLSQELRSRPERKEN